MRALVLDGNGFHYVGSTGQETVFVSHSDFTVTSEVDTVVGRELVESTDDETAIQITIRVFPANDDDTPWEDFAEGDAVQYPDLDGTPQLWRVVGITASESTTGALIYDIELNSKLEEDSTRLKDWISRATVGSLSGRADNVSATDLGAGVNFEIMSVSEIATFDNSNSIGIEAELDPSDPNDVGHSGWYLVDDPLCLWRIIWSLKGASPTDLIFGVRKKEAVTASIVEFTYTIPAGATAVDDDTNPGIYTNETAGKGDQIQIFVDTGGFGYGLDIRIRSTTQV